LLQIEREHWERNLARLAGVDEAGRGPLAGPVVAAAVVLTRSFAEAEEHGLLSGLTDSKKLSESRRESFFRLLEDSPFVEIGVGISEVSEIDSVNILRATHLAMSRAVGSLASLPDHILVDGLAVKGFPRPSTPVVAGDSKSLSIAAASVVAKVVRDDLMRKLDVVYPEYGFARHKGYGSKAHIQALFEYGPAPVHRRSFRPVREASEIRKRQKRKPAEGDDI
jgi:ribonuclease HII